MVKGFTRFVEVLERQYLEVLAGFGRILEVIAGSVED